MSCDQAKWFADMKSIIEEIVDKVLERKQPQTAVPKRWLICCAASLALSGALCYATIGYVDTRFATANARSVKQAETIEQLKAAAHVYVMPPEVRPQSNEWPQFQARRPNAL